MLAILMALKAFSSLIRGKNIQVLTDNISAMVNVNHKGGPSPALSKLAMGGGNQDWCLDKVCAYSRSREPEVRLLVQEGQQTQLEASSQTFCLPGPFMGSTHSRQIRELSKYTASAIQQQVLGAVVQSGRCVVSEQLG